MLQLRHPPAYATPLGSCYEAGFDGHLSKPVELSALRQFLTHPKLRKHPPPGS